MPRLTNPSTFDARLLSGRTIKAGETVDVTDEEYAGAGPLFIREDEPEPVAKRKTVKRAAQEEVETTSAEGVEER